MQGIQFERPPTAIASYLMNPIAKNAIFGMLDTPLCFLHIFKDGTPRLNPKLINEIVDGTVLKLKNNLIMVKHRSCMKKSEILALKELVEKSPFPGEFPQDNIDRQLAAGFVPRLENYYNVSRDQMVLLVRNIVRAVIGKHTGITFVRDFYEERSELTALLDEYFSSYFPGSNVNNVPWLGGEAAPKVIIKHGWLSGVVLHAGTNYLMLLTFPPMEERVSNISIEQHVFIQAITLPNFIPFRERRFSGLSSVIYNATRQDIPLQDYQPRIREAMFQVAFMLSAKGRCTKHAGPFQVIQMEGAQFARNAMASSPQLACSPAHIS